MSWRTATGRGLLVVLYFAAATVWLPSWVLRSGFLADASSVVVDAVGLLVWGSALVAGMYVLRQGQRRGTI